MRRGSLSIFAAMSLMLVAAVLFTFLEAARMRTIENLGRMNTDSVLESLFAGYNIPLWERYHLLLMEGNGAENQFSLIQQEALAEELSQCNLNPEAEFLSGGAWNLYRMELADVSFPEYRLVTDQEGSAYASLVGSYMKKNLLVESAQELYSQYEAVKELDQNADSVEEQIESGLKSLEDLEDGEPDAGEAGYDDTGGALTAVKQELSMTSSESSESKTSEEWAEVNTIMTNRDQTGVDRIKANTDHGRTHTDSSDETGSEDAYNPMEVAVNLQKAGLLSLLVENPAEISSKYIDRSQLVSGRQLEQGTMKGSLDQDWYDQTLMNYYFTRYFSDYLDPAEDQALEYELEYIACGKGSDAENLKAVAGWLLGIREASNMAYLLTDAIKCQEALALATALAGATVNPLIIEGVKYGILASWAYAESVLDVRALLQGDRIPLMKNAAQWTSDLDGFAASIGSFGKARECTNGFTYSQYLMSFLLLSSAGSTANRAMDLQETYVRGISGYEEFRMDRMVTDLTINMAYSWDTIFLSLVTVGQVSDRQFVFTDSRTYSYRKAGV